MMWMRVRAYDREESRFATYHDCNKSNKIHRSRQNPMNGNDFQEKKRLEIIIDMIYS